MTPSAWTTSSIGDLVEIVTTTTHPSDAADVPYIGLEHIESGTGRLLGHGSPEDVRSTKRVFRTGDVLYGKLRPYLNKVHVAQRAGICSTDILVLRPRADVSGRLVAAVLGSRDLVRHAMIEAKGDRPRVPAHHLLTYKVRHPISLETQEGIARRVEEMTSLIYGGLDVVNEIVANRVLMKLAVLDGAFSGRLLGTPSDPSTGLPVGWEFTTVGDPRVARVQGGLTKNARRRSLPLQMPYLRVANVQADRLDLEQVKSIGVTSEEAVRYRLERDDLLIIEGNGSQSHIGRVAMWDGSVDGCLHQNHVIRIRATDDMNPRFILHWLLSGSGRRDIVEKAHTTSGLYTLSISKVKELRVPLTTRETQDRVVEEIDAYLSVTARVSDELREATQQGWQLRDAVFASALGGESE